MTVEESLFVELQQERIDGTVDPDHTGVGKPCYEYAMHACSPRIEDHRGYTEAFPKDFEGYHGIFSASYRDDHIG